MKKIISMFAVVAVLVGGGAFYGGMKYAQSRASQRFGNLSPAERQQLGLGMGVFRGDRSGANGGLVTGEIIAKDDKSITVKMRDGGSKIVFYSDATEISKFVEGAISDLAIGKTVMVNGQTNQDGSITAQSVQIRI